MTQGHLTDLKQERHGDLLTIEPVSRLFDNLFGSVEMSFKQELD